MGLWELINELDKKKKTRCLIMLALFLVEYIIIIAFTINSCFLMWKIGINEMILKRVFLFCGLYLVLVWTGFLFLNIFGFEINYFSKLFRKVVFFFMILPILIFWGPFLYVLVNNVFTETIGEIEKSNIVNELID